MTFLVFELLVVASGFDLLPSDELSSKLTPRREFSLVLSLTLPGTSFGMMSILLVSRLLLMFDLMRE